MSDVTIVTEDAARLVAEGGMVNRDEGVPDDVPTWYACVKCDHRMRQTQPHLTPNAHYAHDPSGLGGEWHDVEPDGQFPFYAEVKEWRPAGQWGGVAVKVGMSPVTDVHHADDGCLAGSVDCNCGAVEIGPGWIQHEPRCGEPEPCHPDAKPNMWHWTVEPAESP